MLPFEYARIGIENAQRQIHRHLDDVSAYFDIPPDVKFRYFLDLRHKSFQRTTTTLSIEADDGNPLVCYLTYPPWEKDGVLTFLSCAPGTESVLIFVDAKNEKDFNAHP